MLSLIMVDLKSYIVQKNRLVNTALETYLQESPHSQHLLDAMTYSLMAGGKRIRPILCLAAAEAVGGKGNDALPAACALEMIHTYSLIHDDLPAIDDDKLRRGKPTCHIAFDEATAILAGDALLTMAFQVLSSLQFAEVDRAAKWLKVIHLIAAAAGYRGMILGQILDITSEGKQLSVGEIEVMHALKTGALIEAALQSGAIIGCANNSQLKFLKIYSKKIGLAFQVADDILNVEGNPGLMGKAVGTDSLREKGTYPSILGLEKSKEFAKDLINTALQALDGFDKKADPLRAIATYIIERKQ